MKIKLLNAVFFLLIFISQSTLSFEEIEKINPYNTASYGVRVYLSSNISQAEFKIKSMARWHEYQYQSHSLIVDFDDSDLISTSVGCYANKIYYSRVSVPREVLSKTYVSLLYQSKYGMKSLLIDLNSFVTHVENDTRDKDTYWENGIGGVEKQYAKYLLGKNKCERF